MRGMACPIVPMPDCRPGSTEGGSVASAKQSQEPASELQLVCAAQNGDRDAFATLVQRYWERLYRWLYHLVRDQHQAEDLAQETFLKAFSNLHRFKAGT